MAFVKITEIDILSPTCDVDVWKTYYFGDTKINDVLINDHVFASGIRGNAITEVDEGLKDICEVSGGKKCVSPSEEVDTGRDYVLPRYDVDWGGGGGIIKLNDDMKDTCEISAKGINVVNS